MAILCIPISTNNIQIGVVRRVQSARRREEKRVGGWQWRADVREWGAEGAVGFDGGGPYLGREGMAIVAATSFLWRQLMTAAGRRRGGGGQGEKSVKRAVAGGTLTAGGAAERQHASCRGHGLAIVVAFAWHSIVGVWGGMWTSDDSHTGNVESAGLLPAVSRALPRSMIIGQVAGRQATAATRKSLVIVCFVCTMTPWPSSSWSVYRLETKGGANHAAAQDYLCRVSRGVAPPLSVGGEARQGC